MPERVRRQDQWIIGLSAWIIQDGNYGDFSVGQRAEFALEFYARDQLRRAADAARRASFIEDALYEVSATVTAVQKHAWVLDFGVQAYSEEAPPGDVRVGDRVTGVVYLGVDPFPYFERLAGSPGMPALVYTWDILSIGRLVRAGADGERTMEAEGPYRYEAVDNTDAWHDDHGGVAEYRFTCALVDVPPKRTTATAR